MKCFFFYSFVRNSFKEFHTHDMNYIYMYLKSVK